MSISSVEVLAVARNTLRTLRTSLAIPSIWQGSFSSLPTPPCQAYGATKVTDGFNAVLDTYTQIKAVSLWTNSTAWFVVDNFPYDCLIRPGTTQATALQAVIAAHPGQFVTCIRTTGNVIQPNCTP